MSSEGYLRYSTIQYSKVHLCSNVMESQSPFIIPPKMSKFRLVDPCLMVSQLQLLSSATTWLIYLHLAHMNVSAFNLALSNLGRESPCHQTQNQHQLLTNIYSVYTEDLSKKNSKAVPCINLGCSAKTHSICFKKHSCSFSTSSRKRENIGMTSFLALQN